MSLRKSKRTTILETLTVSDPIANIDMQDVIKYLTQGKGSWNYRPDTGIPINFSQGDDGGGFEDRGDTQDPPGTMDGIHTLDISTSGGSQWSYTSWFVKKDGWKETKCEPKESNAGGVSVMCVYVYFDDMNKSVVKDSIMSKSVVNEPAKYKST
ncbi:hypothetical protein Godav_024906 [Gossypium davidsonii]|uniref:Uncharacterized protein n=1 Tax=Gossypium davidsonii TaxID=34287 RepID=A0A7J8TAA8_GOSDV|nr:hypothetical protein [Gossypium davidsonii]